MSINKTHVVIGNFAEADNKIRQASKVYIVGGDNGDGFEKRKCVIRMRDGKLKCAWLNLNKLSNFRSAWLPNHIRLIAGDDSAAMTKEQAASVADRLLNNERGE